MERGVLRPSRSVRLEEPVSNTRLCRFAPRLACPMLDLHPRPMVPVPGCRNERRRQRWEMGGQITGNFGTKKQWSWGLGLGGSRVGQSRNPPNGETCRWGHRAMGTGPGGTKGERMYIYLGSIYSNTATESFKNRPSPRSSSKDTKSEDPLKIPRGEKKLGPAYPRGNFTAPAVPRTHGYPASCGWRSASSTSSPRRPSSTSSARSPPPC